MTTKIQYLKVVDAMIDYYASVETRAQGEFRDKAKENKEYYQRKKRRLQ